MPRHQRPDITNRLRRQFGIVGSADFDTIAPEIVPVLPVEQRGGAPEDLALQGAVLAAGTNTITATGGNVPHVLLFNPAGSGVILVTERIRLQGSGTNDQTHLRIVTGDLSGTVRGTRAKIETRGNIQQAPVGRVLDLDAAATTSGVRVYTFENPSALYPQEIDYPFILAPNIALVALHPLANGRLTASFQWREMRLNPSEELD